MPTKPALKRGGSGSESDGAAQAPGFLFDHMNNFEWGHVFQHPTSAGDEQAAELADSALGALVDAVRPEDFA
jgi:hypothetical protein